jgi:hypothetical protein
MRVWLTSGFDTAAGNPLPLSSLVYPHIHPFSALSYLLLSLLLCTLSYPLLSLSTSAPFPLL